MNKKFVQKLIITKESVGQRLDQVAATLLSLSRSNITKMIKNELLLVNGEPVKPGYLVELGDELSLFYEEKAQVGSIPVIFENDDYFVIDKPSGVSVHPAPGEKDQTVTEYFSERLKAFDDIERPGVVHRLDKGTSGVMVLAKNKKAQEILMQQFKQRSAKKEYIALVRGVVAPKQGVIDMPIGRDVDNRKRLSVDAGGKEAITEFETISSYRDETLLLLRPKTGRTHQLRVHLSALGYPILGDMKYGGKSETAHLPRIFLHARSLTIRDTETGKLSTFVSDLPDELKDYLSTLS